MEQSQFILEVQSRQCLWNPKVESYYDPFKIRLAWEEVAAKMCPGYQNYSDNDKQQTVKELQWNWRNLKDYYKRRNPCKDLDDKTNRTKPLVELLQFLDGVKQEPKLSEEITNKNVFLQIPEYKKVTLNSCLRPKLLNTEPAYQKMDNLDKDSNISFLQSILPELQTLNDRQRFEFKLGVMKLIKKIKYDTEVTVNNLDIVTNSNGKLIEFESFQCPLTPLQ